MGNNKNRSRGVCPICGTACDSVRLFQHTNDPTEAWHCRHDDDPLPYTGSVAKGGYTNLDETIDRQNATIGDLLFAIDILEKENERLRNLNDSRLQNSDS